MKRGFTLVELSIVLVIIGLLIGGILIAQSMIGTARIQAQIRQWQQFDTAANNFKTKFKYLPGDAPTDFGSGSGGDGNGIVGQIPHGFITCGEPILYFMQLSMSGNLNITLDGNAHYIIGQMYPFSSNGRGGWTVVSNETGDVYYISLNTTVTNDCGYYVLSAAGIFPPSEALAIDTKIDDSLPHTGKVAAVDNNRNATHNSQGIQDAIPNPMAFDEIDGACIKSGSPALYNTSRSENNLCRLMVKANIY